MDKTVRISLTGTQDDGSGHVLTTEYTTTGRCYERDGCRYLLYREEDADSGAAADSLLKIRDGLLELTRRGDITSRMVFEPGAGHTADYVTPFGALELEVHTQALSCFWTDSGGRIRITYSLYSAGALLSRNELVIKLKFFCEKP